MIRIFEGTEIHTVPALRDAMFRDRAAQFCGRHGWDLTTDDLGREIDEYDALSPIYVVCEGAPGEHLGSLRLLPTMGRTMIGEHFANLAPADFARPDLMECTRYCIAPGAPGHVSAALFLAVLDLGLRRGWSGSYGVFDARMMRVYSRLGTPTELIAMLGQGRDALCLGKWHFLPELRDVLARRAGGERLAMAA